MPLVIMIAVCVKMKATGVVQGVGFRMWLQRHARRRGLKGWVRNVSDHSVEALICGEEKPVAELIDLARRGPAGALVTSFSYQPADHFPGQDFEIWPSV